jgi:hypothetical protein
VEFHLCDAHSCRVTTTGIHILNLCVSFLLVVQAVDKFIYDLGLKESNLEKWHKITTLALHEDEWMRVRLFCNILQVSPFVYIFDTITNNIAWPCFSTPTTPSRRFLLPRCRHFTMHCPHWRSSTQHGRRPPSRLVIPLLYRLSPLEWSSSIHTINVRLNLMRISWQWVSNFY